MASSETTPQVSPRNDPDPAIDDEPVVLTLSEEQLRVDTQRIVTGYARLEKFLVTETKTITIEVTHEEVRLVHGAVPDSRSVPTSRQPSTPSEAKWMVVSREEVTVTKKIVPVERVRLEVFPVTEQRQIAESIRKEHIDTVNLPADHRP